MPYISQCREPGCEEVITTRGVYFCSKHRGARFEAGLIKPNYYQAAVLEKNTREPVAVECFDVIDALDLDFYLGNALKYLWRAGKKDGASKVDDLKKIRTYIDAALQREGKKDD